MTVLIGLCSHAWAEPSLKTFTYRVRTPSLEKSCHAEAVELGKRFADATKLQVTKSECVGRTSPSQDPTVTFNVLVITYRAERQVVPYTATFGFPTLDRSETPSANKGVYASYLSCVADLASQVAKFEQNTGLGVVTTTCEPGRALDSSYVMNLSAFGTPKTRLFAFRSFSEGVASENLDAVQGLLLIKGALAIGRSGEIFFYYAPAPIGLSLDLLGYFRDAAECAAQKAEASKILTSAGAITTVSTCVQNQSSDGAGLEVISDAKVILSSDFGQHGPTYYSFTECLEDKVRVIEQTRSEGIKPLGGLCLPEFSTEGTYRLNLFSVL
jgi:hypothetical protein